MVSETNNMFIVYFSDPVTVYPAGHRRWGQVVREPNNMFIVYFSGPVTVYPAGHRRWGQVVREPNNMFIVYFSGPVTVHAAGHRRWGQVVREPNNMFIVYFSYPPHRHDIVHTVYPAGSSRWGHICTVPNMSTVHAWCVSDIKEVLQAHTAAHPDLEWPSYGMVFRTVSHFCGALPYRTLWGDPAEDSWSEEAWTRLLQTVPITMILEQIVLPPTAPIRGLLAYLAHLHSPYIIVFFGTAGLGELEARKHTFEQAEGRVVLVSTTILVPEGKEDSLRTRRDRLFEAVNGRGLEVQNPKWRTQAGEEYVWTDGWK